MSKLIILEPPLVPEPKTSKEFKRALLLMAKIGALPRKQRILMTKYALRGEHKKRYN